MFHHCPGNPWYNKANESNTGTYQTKTCLRQINDPVVLTGHGDNHTQHMIQAHTKKDNCKSHWGVENPVTCHQSESGNTLYLLPDTLVNSLAFPLCHRILHTCCSQQGQNTKSQSEVDGKTHGHLLGQIHFEPQPVQHTVDCAGIIYQGSQSHGDHI